MQGRVEQLCLLRRSPHELHISRVQVVEAALDLHLSTEDLLTDRSTVLQQEVDRVEHVHSHRMCCHGLHAVSQGLVGHRSQVEQKALKR